MKDAADIGCTANATLSEKKLIIESRSPPSQEVYMASIIRRLRSVMPALPRLDA
jgi:hypothetical protein